MDGGGATSPRLADGPAICEAYGIKGSTLRNWAARRKVKTFGRDSRGRTLYDVAEVETVLGQSPMDHPGTRLGGCLVEGCVLPSLPQAPVPLCVPHMMATMDYGRRAERVLAPSATL